MSIDYINHATLNIKWNIGIDQVLKGLFEVKDILTLSQIIIRKTLNTLYHIVASSIKIYLNQKFRSWRLQSSNLFRLKFPILGIILLNIR